MSTDSIARYRGQNIRFWANPYLAGPVGAMYQHSDDHPWTYAEIFRALHLCFKFYAGTEQYQWQLSLWKMQSLGTAPDFQAIGEAELLVTETDDEEKLNGSLRGVPKRVIEDPWAGVKPGEDLPEETAWRLRGVEDLQYMDIYVAHHRPETCQCNAIKLEAHQKAGCAAYTGRYKPDVKRLWSKVGKSVSKLPKDLPTRQDVSNTMRTVSGAATPAGNDLAGVSSSIHANDLTLAQRKAIIKKFPENVRLWYRACPLTGKGPSGVRNFTIEVEKAHIVPQTQYYLMPMTDEWQERIDANTAKEDHTWTNDRLRRQWNLTWDAKHNGVVFDHSIHAAVDRRAGAIHPLNKKFRTFSLLTLSDGFDGKKANFSGHTPGIGAMGQLWDICVIENFMAAYGYTRGEGALEKSYVDIDGDVPYQLRPYRRRGPESEASSRHTDTGGGTPTNRGTKRPRSPSLAGSPSTSQMHAPDDASQVVGSATKILENLYFGGKSESEDESEDEEEDEEGDEEEDEEEDKEGGEGDGYNRDRCSG